MHPLYPLQISPAPHSGLVKKIKGAPLYKEDAAVTGYSPENNLDRWHNLAPEAWKNVAWIREVLYYEFKYLCYQFYFLMHAHPDHFFVFILGHECLSFIDIVINMATPHYREVYPDFPNFGLKSSVTSSTFVWLDRLSQDGSNRSDLLDRLIPIDETQLSLCPAYVVFKDGAEDAPLP